MLRQQVVGMSAANPAANIARASTRRQPRQRQIILKQAVGFANIGSQYTVPELGVLPLAHPVFGVNECVLRHERVAVVEHGDAFGDLELTAGDDPRL